jgi:translation initiation factor 3 subunit C|uniref:Eukaryotic translation initiation factor 3 subunit C n=1 Tax=Panagrolaimus davidi TaxID=227884 RepID=A0A914Q7M2_9BILA
MSKFFKGGSSSSESSDSDSSDDVPVNRQPTKAKADFNFLSESEDESPKRIVRASKDKVYDELKENIRLSRNAEKIKDFTKLLTGFESISKAFDKAKTVMNREGLTIPRFYIRYLVELEDFINAAWDDKDARTSLSKVNAKSLSAIRQKIRKYNRDFDTEISAYREGPDPVGYVSDEEKDGRGSEDGKDDVAPVAESKKQKFDVSSGDDDEDDDWSTDSDDTESDIDLEGKEMEDLRKYFLKSTKSDKPVKKRENKEDRKHKVEKQRQESDDEGWNVVQVMGEKPLFPNKNDITIESYLKKFNEVNMIRGRKSTNSRAHLRYLQECYDIAVEKNFGPGVLVKVRLTIISALFEMDTKTNTAMDYNAWNKTREAVTTLFDLLKEHPNVVVSVQTNDEEENFHQEDKPYRINGSLALLIKRLDDELIKIFQHADCHSTDYIEKLKGERELCILIEKAQAFVDTHLQNNIFDNTEVATIYLLRIEHLYYKYSSNERETEQLMDMLCKKIYALKNVMQFRQRAMLCQIYNHALHDRWHKAKDLLLMSHLQAIVDHSDAATQVLYNRTICQLGLCAFRHGMIREAHQGLSEIQNTQRAKEFLAQGVPPRQVDKTQEQEAKERSLQVPYHMHINLELLECVYLICSMLLEIPNIACHEYDARRRLLSRSFHYQLKMSEKSPLIGPPENTREHVVAASRAMLKGDWKKCRDYIINEKMNAKVWNLFRNSPQVKEMVVQRIQEESLRTYLLMYSTVYITVSLDVLVESFELPKQKVYSVISKMIIQEELSATLDEPTNCLIMHRIEPTRLQIAALSLTDKLGQLTENNEQIIEPRGTGRGYAGAGNWYVQRRGDDRTGGDEKPRQRGFHQQDRRGGGGGRKWNTNNKNTYKHQHQMA